MPSGAVRSVGGEGWASSLGQAVVINDGVTERPAIVRGFMKSLDHIDPAHFQRIFRELNAYASAPSSRMSSARFFSCGVHGTGLSLLIASINQRLDWSTGRSP
jgi:hypothetical protein